MCIRKQEAEVNEEEEMDTDTQSSSSSLCKVSTDKNVNACSMEPLDEKQMLRDIKIKRELEKDKNNDLIEGYRTCGISNDALKELKSNGLRALSEEVPLLEFFRYNIEGLPCSFRIC